MSEPCWNYCSVCGRKIPVGEKCYGVKRSSSALVVGESICKDCIEPENFEIHAYNVRQVVLERWEIVAGSDGKEYMVCSECRVQQTLTGTFSYCPNCGADMRGGGEENEAN